MKKSFIIVAVCVCILMHQKTCGQETPQTAELGSRPHIPSGPVTPVKNIMTYFENISAYIDSLVSPNQLISTKITEELNQTELNALTTITPNNNVIIFYEKPIYDVTTTYVPYKLEVDPSKNSTVNLPLEIDTYFKQKYGSDSTIQLWRDKNVSAAGEFMAAYRNPNAGTESELDFVQIRIIQ